MLVLQHGTSQRAVGRGCHGMRLNWSRLNRSRLHLFVVEPVAAGSVAIGSVAVESVAVESVAVESVVVESVAVESVAVEAVGLESVAAESYRFRFVSSAGTLSVGLVRFDSGTSTLLGLPVPWRFFVGCWGGVLGLFVFILQQLNCEVCYAKATLCCLESCALGLSVLI